MVHGVAKSRTRLSDFTHSLSLFHHSKSVTQEHDSYASVDITVGLFRGFSGGSTVKNPPANAGDVGLIPGLGRAPGGGKGNPLQYSCLEKPMDREAWWATVNRVAKSQTQLSD